MLQNSLIFGPYHMLDDSCCHFCTFVSTTIRSIFMILLTLGTSCRGWLSYVFGASLLFVAIFMLITRYCSQGKLNGQIKVVAPPPMNTMEQILAVQNAISQVEELVQDGNIVLLKLRALLLAIPSQVFPRPETFMA